MVVLTSSKHRANRVLASELNLLFGNFEQINLSDLDFNQRYGYLSESIAPCRPSPFFLSFFVKIIGENLVYYRLFADAIKENYSAENEGKSIIATVAAALYSPQTYFYQRFISKVNFLNTYFKSKVPLKVLLAVSEGYRRRSELLSLALCEYKKLTTILQKLVEIDYLENLGNLYRVKDPLFSFWLSYVFKMRNEYLVLNLSQKRRYWQDHLSAAISIFKEEFDKDKIEKVLELLSSFKNDQLRLRDDRLRLPLIERTKVISYPNKFFHLILGEGRELTFIGVKEKNAEDNDIIEFLERAKSIPNKNIKKIFIAFYDLSPSARLIAKDNKLLVWDFNRVNSLLNLYDKPTFLFKEE